MKPARGSEVEIKNREGALWALEADPFWFIKDFRIMVENFARDPTGQRQAGGPPRKHFVKVVVIGNSAVGKTSLIQQFEHARFTEHFKPTIGADFSNKEI